MMNIISMNYIIVRHIIVGNYNNTILYYFILFITFKVYNLEMWKLGNRVFRGRAIIGAITLARTLSGRWWKGRQGWKGRKGWIVYCDAKKSNYRGKTILMHLPVMEFCMLVHSCELMTPHFQRKVKYLRRIF